VRRGDPSSRRRSRQLALQVLYALDVATARSAATGAPTPDREEVFDVVSQNFERPAGEGEFARELVEGIVAARETIDALLEQSATNWRLSRMAAVDRNILRIGTFELLKGETPLQVVLDEAIELARRFGDDPSPRFVNGVLDAVATSLRRGGGAGDRPAEPV
jgi:N utilization substance protein B